MTLIYADNAQGKTMLSAILRSLAEDEPKYIIGRTTVGQPDPPQVYIEADGTVYRFDGAAWQAHLPAIEVFDPVFVSDNVCAGREVSHAHKQNLFGYVVGPAAVKFAKDLTRLAEEIRAKGGELKELESQIRPLIEGSMSTEEFVSAVTGSATETEERSREAERQLDAATSAARMAAAQRLAMLEATPFPESEVLRALQDAVEGLSPTAVARVKQHVSSLEGPTQPEEWLRQGVFLVADGDPCPFCGQDLADSDLFEAYEGYFVGEYHRVVEEVVQLFEGLRRWEDDREPAAILTGREKNDERARFWQQYVTRPTPAFLPGVDLPLDWTQAREAVREALERKLADPLEAQQVDGVLGRHLATFRSVGEAVRRYNEECAAYNLEIEQVLAAAKQADVPALQKQVVLCRNMVTRSKPENERLCQEYRRCQDAKAKLERQRQETKDALAAETQRVLETYHEDLNRFLDRFGATFRIVVDTKVAHSGGVRPAAKYCISINGEAIELGDARTDEGTPCFKNTLSEGDKSTLALAFFLARLEQDPNRASKIVVLDDPISSLDIHRREMTQQSIRWLSGRVAQTICHASDGTGQLLLEIR